MRLAISAAVVALSACASVVAEPMFVNDNVQVTFHRAPCEFAHLKMFLKQFGDDAKKATVRFNGQVIEACYTVDDEGNYVIVDMQGSGAVLPAKSIRHGA